MRGAGSVASEERLSLHGQTLKVTPFFRVIASTNWPRVYNPSVPERSIEDAVNLAEQMHVRR